MKVACAVLEKCHHSMGSHDYSMSNLAHFIAKIITSGPDSADALAHMISFLDTATLHDLLWQRICSSLVGYFSNAAVDVFVEGVLLNTKPSLQSSSATCRILGNLLATHNRLSYILCHKCLLVRCYDETGILYNIAGYLRSSMSDVMEQALVCLLKVWSDIGLVCHLDYRHLLHLSRAIVLFTSCLSNQLSSEVCSDVFRLLMNGMEHHMNNPISNYRLLAMRLAECVSQQLKKDGSPLKFDIEESKETLLLATMATPINEQEKSLIQNDSLDQVIQTELVDRVSEVGMSTQEETDSDDDLIPYDITSCDCGDVTCDNDMPHYLREAMQGILDNTSGSDQLKFIRAIPSLIKSSHHDLDEVCEELTKVLLHSSNQIKESKQAAKEAIVSLLCNCPVKVSSYLIGQFHSTGFSIEQRLYMLELLSVAALELSTPNEDGINVFTSVVNHFYYPLMKYFEQDSQQDDLLVAHVIHTLAHMIHCATPLVDTRHGKMSEHLLEVLLQYRSHSNAFVRQSTLRSLSIIIAIHQPVTIVSTTVSQWLQDTSEDDSDQQCRSLATQISTIYNVTK
ncbi:telomere length regulation protein TEL2 homolog isoform X2 [Dysidea avara]